MAGRLYGIEDFPEPVPINENQLLKGMEIETSFALYNEEIKKCLEGSHWYLMYFDENDDIIA